MSNQAKVEIPYPIVSDTLLDELGKAFDREENGMSAIGNICVKNKSTNRAKILEYEEMAKELPQVDIPVNHHIHGGMYAREITIPEGTIITGQLYKFDHFDIMVSGDVTVSTDTGETRRLTGETRRLTGFNLLKGMSGKKRAGYAHKDTHWVTFHNFDGDDGEEIQKYITAETFTELENFHTEINRADYYNFVCASGMTQEEILEQVENQDDMITDKIESVFVGDSKISGKGLLSHFAFNSGDVICQARIGDKRTLAGRYTNHAVFPNAEIIVTENGADLIAIRDIEEGEEITVNYRDVIKHRFIKGDLLCQE